MRILLLVLLFYSANCATSAWHSAWTKYPVSETISLRSTGSADAARLDTKGNIFLRLTENESGDVSRFVCLAKQYTAYLSGAAAYSYVTASIQPISSCPDLGKADRPLTPVDATSKLVLPDLGIAIQISGELRPLYAGASLQNRIGTVTSVKRDYHHVITIEDADGRSIHLKSSCCTGDESYYLSESNETSDSQPVPFETIPKGIVVLLSATEARRYAYFISTEASGQAGASFILVDQRIDEFHPIRIPLKIGLIALLPVAIAVDVVTAPIQIIAIAVVANRAIEALEKFPRCLWPG